MFPKNMQLVMITLKNGASHLARFYKRMTILNGGAGYEFRPARFTPISNVKSWRRATAQEMGDVAIPSDLKLAK